MNSEGKALSDTDVQLNPVPVWRDLPFRIAMTTSCRDCDNIPKVPRAGSVVEENGQHVQIMHNGVRVIAGGYDGDWMTEIIKQLKGHHEPQEEAVFHEILKALPERATMVELGGYWSYYSLWFLQSAPQHRRSIVVEPDPHHLDVGRLNASLNGRSIEFIQASVGEVVSDLIEFESHTSGTILIPQVSIPSLMRDRNIEILDILHCDTQGAEISVLKSCMNLLKEKRIRFGVFSTHARDFTNDSLTHQRCLAMIQAFGGQILAEHEVHESYSGDGLIAAYFGPAPLEWPHLEMSYNRYSNSLFRNPLYDLADFDELHSANARLKKQVEELQAKFFVRKGKYPLGSSNDLEKKYDQLYENFRLAQRRPLRLLWHHSKWRLNRFLLRFSIILPTRWLKGMRRRVQKYQPLPRLSEARPTESSVEVESSQSHCTQSKSVRSLLGALHCFLTVSGYRKRITSKFALYFSPFFTPRFKQRMRRRYEKNRLKSLSPTVSQPIEKMSSSDDLISTESKIYPQSTMKMSPADEVAHSKLTETARVVFRHIEHRFFPSSPHQ
jgi:FkbM family methyltransferase